MQKQINELIIKREDIKQELISECQIIKELAESTGFLNSKNSQALSPESMGGMGFMTQIPSILAVILGTAANGFAKGAQGFTLFVPSILTAITIVGCMYALSIVMKSIPVGITYASFAGLCIIATTLVGIYKFNQMPDLFTTVGLVLIISGVLIVNLLGKTN